MTTKHTSGLAASGRADEPDSEQITKEHSDEIEDIVVDPSDDVTVEASEDVTSEAVAHTPPPSLRRTPDPIVDGYAPRPSSPTLLGVPIQSLPLPGVTAASSPRSELITDEQEEVTAMAAPSIVDELLARGPSITDDDEEETKVEPAEAALKASASIEDVSTALSAQASLEREKALRRSVPSALAPTSADLEFEDPDAGDDDDDEGEVLSASHADEIQDDDDDDANAGVDDDDDEGGAEDVATGTFAKPIDSTGFSGLLARRSSPPTGSPFGRDSFGSARLPTPSPGYTAGAYTASAAPAPSTSPFSSRLSPVPAGSPYGARAATSSMPAIHIPAPSAAPATTEGMGLFSRVQVPIGLLGAAAISFFFLGFGVRAGFWPSRPAAPPAVATKQVVTPAPAPTPPAPPAVEPAQTPPAGTTAQQAGATPEGTTQVKQPPPGDPPLPVIEPDPTPPPRPKKLFASKPKKPVVDDPIAEETTPKAATKVNTVAPKPAPAPAAPKKKPTKVWVDPFAN
jgi:hypothetical protein